MNYQKKSPNNKPEDLVAKLQVFSQLQYDKRQLLKTTLAQVTLNDQTDQAQQRLLLQNSEPNNDHRTKQSNAGNIMSKLRLYIPVASVALIIIVAGTFMARKNNLTNTKINNISSEQTVPNGSIENTINSFSADINAESSIDQQALAESQAATEEISNNLKQLGDVNNDTSF